MSNVLRHESEGESMSTQKTLEEVAEQARKALRDAERNLAIKNYIIDQLTDAEGTVIDTDIQFELGELKIHIGKRRARQRADKEGGRQVKRSAPKAKTPRRSKAEKEVIFQSCLDTSFSGLKKGAAIAKLQEVSPNFAGNLWGEFVKAPYIAERLSREGKTRDMSYTFNVASEAPKKPAAKKSAAKKPAAKKPAAKKPAAKKPAAKKPAAKRAAAKKPAAKKSAAK